jgi:hypothetical protein
MLTQLEGWNPIKGTSTAELLLELVSNDQEVQRKAWDALNYTLLNAGADRPENYGDPELLLNTDVLIQVVPLLAKIIEINQFNWLSKYFALGLLWDIYNFASVDTVQQYDPQKTKCIQELVVSFKPEYQEQLNHEVSDIRARVQRLLKRIE